MGFGITYDIMDGHSIVHTKDGEVQFNKDEMGIPNIYEKNTRTWLLYKQSANFLEVSQRKKSMWINLLVNPRE